MRWTSEVGTSEVALFGYVYVHEHEHVQGHGPYTLSAILNSAVKADENGADG